jgi:hypothetical protein
MSDTMQPTSLIPDEDLLDIEDQLEQYKKNNWGRQHETEVRIFQSPFSPTILPPVFSLMFSHS